MSPTLSGHHTHHKDGAKLFAYGVTAVVVVGAGVVVVVAGAVVVVAGAVVVVGRMGVVVVVVDGFTVDDVEELELLVELDVELVDDVDPRLVPSSVG